MNSNNIQQHFSPYFSQITLHNNTNSSGNVFVCDDAEMWVSTDKQMSRMDQVSNQAARWTFEQIFYIRQSRCSCRRLRTSNLTFLVRESVTRARVFQCEDEFSAGKCI